MCRCWQIPLALGLTMFDLVTPNRFQKIPIAILDEKLIHLFVVITKNVYFGSKNIFFALQVLQDEQVLFSFFFFWQDIDFILMSRERTCMSLVKRVCMLVCVLAGLTLLWPCLVLSPLSCLHLSPPKRRRKKKKADKEMSSNLWRLRLNFPPVFHLSSSFHSLYSGCLFCLGFMTCASWLLWSINKR